MAAFHDPSFASWNDPGRMGYTNRFSDTAERTANTPENRGGVTTVAFPPAGGERVVLNSELLLREPFATALEDEDDRYVLYIYQPNMRKKDLELSISGDILHIKGQRLLRGVTYEFKREIALPQDADVSQIEAEYQTGRINITIPKVSAKKIHRSIPIGGIKGPEKKQAEAESKQETEKEKQPEPSPTKRSIPISGATAAGTTAAAGTGDTCAGAGTSTGIGAGAGAGSSGSDRDTGGGIESPLEPRPPQESAQQGQAPTSTSTSQVPTAARSESEPPPVASDVSLSGHDVATAKQRLEEEQKTHQLEQDIRQHKPHVHGTQQPHHTEGQHGQPSHHPEGSHQQHHPEGHTQTQHHPHVQQQQQQQQGAESETQPSATETIKSGLSAMAEKVKSTLGAAIGKGEEEKTSSSSTEKS